MGHRPRGGGHLRRSTPSRPSPTRCSRSLRWPALEAWLGPDGGRLRWLARKAVLVVAACVVAHLLFALATLAAAGQLPDWGQYIAYLRAFLFERLGDLNYDFARWSPGLAVGATYLASAAGIVLALQRLPDLVRARARGLRRPDGHDRLRDGDLQLLRQPFNRLLIGRCGPAGPAGCRSLAQLAAAVSETREPRRATRRPCLCPLGLACCSSPSAGPRSASASRARRWPTSSRGGNRCEARCCG